MSGIPPISNIPCVYSLIRTNGRIYAQCVNRRFGMYCKCTALESYVPDVSHFLFTESNFSSFSLKIF